MTSLSCSDGSIVIEAVVGVASPVSTASIAQPLENALDGTNGYRLVPGSSVEVFAISGDVSLFCDFEAVDDVACAYTNQVATFNWTRHMGITPTNDTGPYAAHSGNYFLYLEASAPRVAGDIAKYASFNFLFILNIRVR